jgi:hypothetical protein
VREVFHPYAYASVVVLRWQTAWGIWVSALGLVAAWGAVGLLRAEVSRSQDEG